MNKSKKLIIMDILILFTFLIAIGWTTYTYTTNPEIFCIEARGEIEEMDAGEICYKTIGEIKERANYLSDKYADPSMVKPIFVYNGT